MKIKKIHARQILDSRGNPTVEADVILENGILGRASVPSGASTGRYEAYELRDNNPTVYNGLGVLNAVENINIKILNALSAIDIDNQKKIDDLLISLDGTANKSNLGANAILAVSLASAKAAAEFLKLPLFMYIAQIADYPKEFLMPIPQINIINGGKHAGWTTDIQEYIIFPIGAKNFAHALEMAANIFHKLSIVLSEKGYSIAVGDEGGNAPQVKGGNEEPFELMALAVERAGYKLEKDIVFGIDCAASGFYDSGFYNLKKENKTFSTDEMIAWLEGLAKQYPIISMEDCLDQNDWDGWRKLTAAVGQNIQVVGDDLFVTNTKFLKKGIEEKAANAILIKPNQIGTLTEAIAAVDMAKKAGWQTIISHRSGETEDTTIAHLAVGLSTGQIKTGSMSRSERIAKYNELLRIEEMLGEKAKFQSFLP